VLTAWLVIEYHNQYCGLECDFFETVVSLCKVLNKLKNNIMSIYVVVTFWGRWVGLKIVQRILYYCVRQLLSSDND
jgi:uncharacterized protein YbcC (UPF0753/DUF2309 family)